MSIGLIQLFAILGMGLTIASALGKAPLWIAVLFLYIVVLMQFWR